MKKWLLLTAIVFTGLVSFGQKPGPDTVYYIHTSDTARVSSLTTFTTECSGFNWTDGRLDTFQGIYYKFTIQYQIDTLCNVSNIRLKWPHKYPVAGKIVLREFMECTHIEFLNGVQSIGCPLTGKIYQQREISISFH